MVKHKALFQEKLQPEMTDRETGGDVGREGSTSPPVTQDASTLRNYNPPSPRLPPQNPPPRALPTNPFQSTPLPPPGFSSATPSPTALPTPHHPLASPPRRALHPQCPPSPALIPPPSSTGRAEPYKALRIRATPLHEIPDEDGPRRNRSTASKKRSKSENCKDGDDEKGGPSAGGISG